MKDFCAEYGFWDLPFTAVPCGFSFLPSGACPPHMLTTTKGVREGSCGRGFS